MQKKVLIIIGIIVSLAIILGGLLFYKGYIYAENINKQISLCEQAYQEKSKAHPEVFNTFDYIERVSCYANIAIKENYLPICDKVDAKNSSYMWDCYVKFAVAKNDLSVCEKLKDIFDSKGNNLQADQTCSKSVKADVEYLNKNNIYVNPNKYGDIKILTPKAGEVLDINKEYKITWSADTFSDKNTINKLTLVEYGSANGTYITFKPIIAKQGYYYFTPNSINDLKLGKKYFIRLNAGSAESFEPTLVGISDLFEFK